MGKPKPPADVKTDERRDGPRVPMDDNVTVTLLTDVIVGPGQNISPHGVFFVAEASLRVKVQMPGASQAVEGKLVRVQHMGEGKLGIAVRFDGQPGPSPE